MIWNGLDMVGVCWDALGGGLIFYLLPFVLRVLDEIDFVGMWMCGFPIIVIRSPMVLVILGVLVGIEDLLHSIIKVVLEPVERFACGHWIVISEEVCLPKSCAAGT